MHTTLLLLEDGYFQLGRGFGFANHIVSAPVLGEKTKQGAPNAIESAIEASENCAIQATNIATLPEKLCGELCFNTSMSGYQEVLSDPSYAGQFICFSFPHIGNVGANPEDCESPTPHALGLICREAPTAPSNWRSQNHFEAWLNRHRISGVCDIDTRALIRHLRENGSLRAMLGTLEPSQMEPTQSSGLGSCPSSDMGQFRVQPEILGSLLAYLRRSPKMAGQNLGSGASRAQKGPYQSPLRQNWWPLKILESTENSKNTENIERAGNKENPAKTNIRPQKSELHIAVLDLGAKENILQSLKRFTDSVTVFPCSSSWAEIAASQPDGLLLSNGPGDPQPLYEKVAPLLQAALAVKLPIFGICMGHQLLALSLGAKTGYMHHGHRGVNHPVLNVQRNTVEITSQNHGFCVSEKDLPANIEVSHRSLFDSCIEGIRSREHPAFSVQYHPESSPGPHESMYLFRDFIDLIERQPNVFCS